MGLLSILVFLVTGYPTMEPNVGIYDYRNKVESIILIPGTGEMVYDTEVAYDSDHKKLNQHREKRTDVLVALDIIAKQYPKLKNIGIVVGWFGSSTDAGKITITPRVEHKYLYKNDSWSVGKITRQNARRISLDCKGQPNWGGTPSDRSIVNLVLELKRRGYNVMLNPMLFIDVNGKPWRGEISARNHNEIDNFFAEYTKFIKHYAELQYKGVRLKDHIKTLVIGSEFKGLTMHKYAIDKFIELAGRIRNIVGPEVKLTYAANWDEYHHSDDGYRYLDWLWADKNIDFVGIDEYVPLTDKMPQSQVTKAMVLKGWESGIYYGYNPGDSGNEPVARDMAIKNIEYWWKSEHYNPDGSITPWKPRMKPIVFTEFGFPPFDGATNEPSKFYDVTTRGAGYPVESEGKYDINAQSMAIEATEEFWRNKSSDFGNEGLVNTRYLYAFDVTIRKASEPIEKSSECPIK